MSEHDALCPAYRPGPLRAICDCALIAKARADEREKYGIGSIEEILHEERERIAQAIEAWGSPTMDRRVAAYIARNGGSDA